MRSWRNEKLNLVFVVDPCASDFCVNAETPFKLASFSEKPSCKIASMCFGLAPCRKNRSPASSINWPGNFLDDGCCEWPQKRPERTCKWWRNRDMSRWMRIEQKWHNKFVIQKFHHSCYPEAFPCKFCQCPAAVFQFALPRFEANALSFQLPETWNKFWQDVLRAPYHAKERESASKTQ